MVDIRDTAIRDNDPATIIANLHLEIDTLRHAINRHIERAAFDDYNAMHLGVATALPWAELAEADREVYRGAVAADFWRDLGEARH
jgi:hypothetical protein